MCKHSRYKVNEVNFQCKVVKQTKDGRQLMTTYLPSKFAKIGEVLKLKNSSTEEWSNGWRVTAVYNCKDSESLINTRAAMNELKRKLKN